jgi:hypothetical protein
MIAHGGEPSWSMTHQQLFDAEAEMIAITTNYHTKESRDLPEFESYFEFVFDLSLKLSNSESFNENCNKLGLTMILVNELFIPIIAPISNDDPLYAKFDKKGSLICRILLKWLSLERRFLDQEYTDLFWLLLNCYQRRYYPWVKGVEIETMISEISSKNWAIDEFGSIRVTSDFNTKSFKVRLISI